MAVNYFQGWGFCPVFLSHSDKFNIELKGYLKSPAFRLGKPYFNCCYPPRIKLFLVFIYIPKCNWKTSET